MTSLLQELEKLLISRRDLASLDLDLRALLDDAHVRRGGVRLGEALVHHRLHLRAVPVGPVTNEDFVAERNHIGEVHGRNNHGDKLEHR